MAFFWVGNLPSIFTKLQKLRLENEKFFKKRIKVYNPIESISEVVSSKF